LLGGIGIVEVVGSGVLPGRFGRGLGALRDGSGLGGLARELGGLLGEFLVGQARGVIGRVVVAEFADYARHDPSDAAEFDDLARHQAALPARYPERLHLCVDDPEDRLQ
jgi:hypothetical protein